MSDKNIKSENRISLSKIALVLFLYAIFVYGIYKKAIKMRISIDLVKMALIAFIVFTVIVGIIFIILKGEKKIKFTKILIILIIFVVIIVNVYYLAADYFVPHTTTTINNRYGIHLLRVTRNIQSYVQDKTLLVDKSNKYLSWEYFKHDYITMSDIVSIYYTANAIERFNEDVGPINNAQIEYLMSLDKDDYIHDENPDNSNRAFYFYFGEQYSDCDTVVFLASAKDEMFFLPYELYLEIEDIG